MLTIKFALLANSVVIDSSTSQLSIFNIIEEIQSPKLPSAISNVTFLAIIEKLKNDAHEHELKIAVFLNTKKLGESIFNINFVGNNRNRTIMNIPLIPLIEYGDIVFKIIKNNKILDTHIIPFTKNNEPQTAES